MKKKETPPVPRLKRKRQSRSIVEDFDDEDEDDEDISCGHSVEDHQESLRMVMEKMEPAVN